MTETPDTLSAQLSRRVAAFLSATGLTHKQLARLVGCDRSQLTSFLSTGKGLSAERSLRLMQVLNCSRSTLEAKFGRKVVNTQIVRLQEKGRPMMKLDDGSGWLPREGSNDDPNGTTDITNTWKVNGQPVSDDLINALRQIDSIHKEASKAINDYISKAAQAKVNRDGPTEPARRIGDNEHSKTPGPRPSLFNITPDPHRLLAYLKEDRERIESELALQRAIAAEREKRDKVRMELAEVKR